jgi:uncharacterized membrane protein
MNEPADAQLMALTLFLFGIAAAIALATGNVNLAALLAAVAPLAATLAAIA